MTFEGFITGLIILAVFGLGVYFLSKDIGE
jgi:hypothetical protein